MTTRRELLVLVAAVFYGLVWIVCAVAGIANLRATPPIAPPVTPATCCPAVEYQP